MGKKIDKIELILPFKAEYVSIARLVVSGAAHRIGFDIEAIEDMKVAVAEVCNKLTETGSNIAESYRMILKIDGKNIEVLFDCEDKSLKCIFNEKEDELGISIINALMDKVELCTDNEYILSMTKCFEGNI